MGRRVGNWLGAVPLVLVASLASAQGVPSSDSAQPIAPPADSFALGEYSGSGVQIYACRLRGRRPAWVFQAAEVTLLDGQGRQYGNQVAGSRWMLDGRRSWVGVWAEAPAPVAGAIPWQQLTLWDSGPGESWDPPIGRAHGPSGGLPDIIRRHDTVGGVAPTTACTSGEVARVRFSALYGFYRQR